MHEVQVSEYVFPNLSSGKHLSQAGMSSVSKRLNKKSGWLDKQGRKITVHGFRSTFRDYHEREVVMSSIDSYWRYENRPAGI